MKEFNVWLLVGGSWVLDHDETEPVKATRSALSEKLAGEHKRGTYKIRKHTGE